MKKTLVLLIALAAALQASAQTQQFGVDLPKLFLHGELMTDVPPLPPNSRGLADAVAQMKAATGLDAPIKYYWRVVKMKQQPSCGRVTMIPIQGTKALGPFAMGAFLCEDGSPPFMVCPEKKAKLIPPNTKCKGGVQPVFSEEAQAMYDQAIRDGGKSITDAARILKNAQPKK